VEYSLRALKIGESVGPGPLFTFMSNWEKVEWGPHFIYLLQGGGRTILIHTGLPQDPEDLGILNAACRTSYEDNWFQPDHIWTPFERLAEVGVKPKDVDAILIISMGTYATGNIECFPDAEVYLSRTGWVDFMVPKRPSAGSREVILTDATLTYLVTKGWKRLHLVGDEEEVLPGIKMFWVGGHHRSSMAVVIPTAKGKVVISDTIFVYENFDPGISIGVAESLFECEDALERIRKEADIVVPKHDGRVLERYPDGIIA
jgi:glyoxylase-like metal-dependent hydrolase (beta-lactamase superfamily II)